MTAIRSRKRPNSATGYATDLDKAAAPAELHKAILALKVAQRATGELSPPPREFRKHSQRQLRLLETSIREFGIVRPLLVDATNRIVAGYGVWMAARQLGLLTVPVICIDHLTAEQIRLYRIMDNQSATLASWDQDLLRLELGELYDLSFETGLDVELTGFTSADIDQILLGGSSGTKGEASGSEEAEDVEPGSRPAVSRLGDLWLLGGHRLYCGNSLEAASYQALLAGEPAQMVVSDPPFNVTIADPVSGRKRVREFAFASVEMSAEEFIAFLQTVFRHAVEHSLDGSIHYHFIDWRHVWEMISAGREEYAELKNILVWAKTNASRGFYRSQHELICVFKHGTADHICTFGIEKGARVRSNVITMAGCNSFGKNGDEDLADHPTVTPVSLIGDLMRDCSKRNGIILDPFGGSGDTLLAAEWTRRRARLIEIDPLYVDVAIRRWEKRTGQQAVLDGCGLNFADVASERGVSSLDEEGQRDG